MSEMLKLQIFLIYLFFLVITDQANGYFDPGTGSILLQLLIAMIGGVIVFYNKAIIKIKRFPDNIRSYLIKNERSVGDNFNRHYLLAAMIGVYAAVFYGSHNVDHLTISILVLNIFLFASFSLLLTLTCVMILQKRKNQEKILHGLLFLLFIYYMRVPIVEIAKIFLTTSDGKPPQLLAEFSFIFAIVVLFFVMGWKLYNKGVKVIVVIMIMSILPIFEIVKGKYQMSAAITTEVSEESLPLIDEHIDFQRKPNVYFFLFDAHTNKEGLESMGLSTTQIFDYLDKEQFTVYHNYYSNYQRTPTTMSSYFNMSLGIDNKIFYSIELEEMQKIIAGNGIVFKVFKKNHYETNIIIGETPSPSDDINIYLLGGFCFADSCLGGENSRLSASYLRTFDRIVLNNMFELSRNPQRGTNHGQNMKNLREVTNSNRRKFVYLHFSLPGHVDTHLMDKGICSEVEEAKKYEHRLNATHSLMARSVSMIKEFDPNALIVFASDSGPYIDNRCANFVPLLTREEVVERQGVFLAIKWGKDYDGRYDKNIKSSANLFRYIFSYLAGNEKLLYSKPDDDAFYQYKGKVIKSIDDGVILPPPAAELNNSN